VNEIDYINAHGTGTQANDSAEGNAIVSLFPDQPYVGSSKSVTGHTLGASGALEAIISCMVIKEQMIPPNSFLENIENPSLNLVLEVQKTAIEYVMSNSFAFGGNNCSLIFGKVSHVS
jgi:3-oxoacyl-[acyl-carrier-protein] synthase-1